MLQFVARLFWRNTEFGIMELGRWRWEFGRCHQGEHQGVWHCKIPLGAHSTTCPRIFHYNLDRSLISALVLNC